jgi:hypothetical protein
VELALTRAPRWRLVLDAVLAVLAGGFGALCVRGVLSAPFGGMRAPLYLIVAAMLVLAGNRALALLAKLMVPGAARNLVRVAKWTVPFVLPFLAIPPLERAVQAQQLALAGSELAPLVRHAEDHVDDPNAPLSTELPPISFARPVYYRRDAEADLVWLEVPTIDIDGATLVYDARTKAWTRTHNDEAGAPRPFNDATCTLRAGTWTCPEPGE